MMYVISKGNFARYFGTLLHGENGEVCVMIIIENVIIYQVNTMMEGH